MPEAIIFIISLAALIFGADWLGNTATHIAKSLSLPIILIGATIVSLATTLPEVAVAGFSGTSGVPELGIGTVLGSPLVNIGLIYGVLLLFSRARVEKAYFSRTVQFLFTVLALLLLIFLGGTITKIAGGILILAGFFYLAAEFIVSKSEQSLIEKIETRFERLRLFFADGKHYQQIFYLFVGSALLLLGAHFLVDSAVVLAEILRVPQVLIGVFLVAAGTSLPELFTAIVSITRGRDQIAVGNLFGASVLDLTFGLGAASVFAGARIEAASSYLMVGAIFTFSILSLVSVFGKISPKVLGGILIAVYLIFVVWFGRIEI